MDHLFNVDWHSMFFPNESLAEIFIRGTIMYLGMFALLRFFRRQAGSVGTADLLMIVVIADAAQNGMAGDSKSITESILLICTIVFWDYLIDVMAYKFEFVNRIMSPKELLLIQDGKLLRRNMSKEMISYEELISQLRQHGIEKISEVKKCHLESNGHFSILTKDKDSDKPRPNTGDKSLNH